MPDGQAGVVIGRGGTGATELKEAIATNVTGIVNYDPRTSASGVQVSEYESGIQIECTLKYLQYNISENVKLNFDKANGLS